MMKRVISIILMMAVFVVYPIRGATSHDISSQITLRDITIDWNESLITFTYDGYFFPEEYIEAENTLNDFFIETHGLEQARVYVERFVENEYQVYVEIDLGDSNYMATDRVFNIECNLFKFVLTQKGLKINDINISQSGSLIEANATVIFNTQFGVSYDLLCNGVVLQRYKWSNPSVRYVPVTQDGVYTISAYVYNLAASEDIVCQGPVKMSGSACFSDHLTPFGGTISGLDRYYQGATGSIAIVSTSAASGGPSDGNYSYSWEMYTGSYWEIMPNKTDVNCMVNASGHSKDIYLRRKVTKAGRMAYSNIHVIKSKKTAPVYTNLNSITKTVYTSENTDNNPIKSVEYFDGLGRLMQTVQVATTPNYADLVSHQEYDSFGRKSIQWLPAPVEQNNGAFIPINSFIDRTSSTYAGDLAPYSKSFYEASPLSRIEQEYGPGYLWYNNSGSIKTAYMTNAAENDTLNCIYYTVSDPDEYGITLNKVRSYSSNELYVTRIEDEDGGVQFHFKDRLDNLILIRQLEQNKNARIFSDTYYIYDAFKNLRVVLPPLASAQLISGNSWPSSSSALLNDYAYLYKYDGRNRCVAKKLPGLSWAYFIYDHADRLIFTQNGEQRSRNEWHFSLPDVFSRESLTGLCYNNLNPFNDPLKNIVVNVQRDLNMDIYKGYKINGITLSYPVILTVNYYDNYIFKVKDGVILTASPNSYFNYEVLPNFDDEWDSPVGMLTGSITARITGATTTDGYDYTVMYYDIDGRLIQSKSTNHLDGHEAIYTAYNFVGQPTLKRHIHSAPGKATQNELYSYTYDHTGRLLTVRHKLNNGSEVTLTDNEYDELGRVRRNRRNGQAGLTTSYDYNIRSWISKITNTHFTESLEYTFNGNIRTQEWRQANKLRKYEFSYDPLSRLTKAKYSGDGSYDTNYVYDRHGNIINLFRWGNTGTSTYGLIDNLTMSYKGNQLIKVDDTGSIPGLSSSADFRNGPIAATEYFYDTNGNLKKDLNKGISNIEYNSLNLPGSLSISNSLGSATNTYIYATDGRKLSVKKGSFKTDYAGYAVYENGTFKRLLVEGGYYENGAYHFYVTDHLGNNRIVANQDAAIKQSTQYYPFGMAFADGAGQAIQPHKYNGKELDSERGLNWYDYMARYYDPALGRFTTMDPLAEKYYSISPYVYCANNPLKYIDPMGMERWRTSNPDEIERLLLELRLGKKIDAKSFSDQWTLIADTESGDNDRAVFDDVLNTFMIDGESWEDFGYGINNNMSMYGFLFRTNTTLGLGGTFTGFSPASFRLTNGAYNGSVFSPKLYASGWAGGSVARITTYKLAKIGKITALGALISSVVLDVYGMQNYFNNPFSPNAVPPAKAGLNAMAGYAAYVNPYFGIPYGLSELFIPGGFVSVMRAHALIHKEHNELGRGKWWYPRLSSIIGH